MEPMKFSIAGGRAHHRGVSFYGRRYVATALRKNAKIVIHLKPRKRIWNSLAIDRLPFLRGVLRLTETLWVAGWFGKAALLYLLFWIGWVPWQNVGATLWTDHRAWIAIALALGWIRISSLGKYHGAEHKAFNAWLEGKPLRVDQARTSSRVARQCGTNLVVIYLMIHACFSLFLPAQLAFLVSFSIAWELFRLGDKKWVSPFVALGAGVQKYIVATEPNDAQLEVALEALQALLRAERQR